MKSWLSFAVVLVVVSAAVVMVRGRTITQEDDDTMPVSSATEHATSLKDVVRGAVQEMGKEDDKKIGRLSDERVMRKQMKSLRKMCQPRLVTVSVEEVLGSSSDLLDNPSLFPRVMAVKRCNATCNYCGNGLAVQGAEYRQVCTAASSRNKRFTIQYSLNDEIKYERIAIKVDRRCKCRTAASITSTSTETPQQD